MVAYLSVFLLFHNTGYNQQVRTWGWLCIIFIPVVFYMKLLLYLCLTWSMQLTQDQRRLRLYRIGDPCTIILGLTRYTLLQPLEPQSLPLQL